MKFDWDVTYVNQEKHTIISEFEETECDEYTFHVKLKDDEGNVLSDEVNFVYYVDIYDENNKYLRTEERVFEKGDKASPCISGKFPEGISIRKDKDSEYTISGTTPKVTEETTYYFTLRARVDVTDELRESQGIPEDVEYLYDDMFLSIVVKNRGLVIIPTDVYEFTEGLYNKVQIELLNGEGDEEFVKLTGNLPKGITLSSSGLLYGIAYSDNNIEKDPQGNIYCLIGIRKNGEVILKQEIRTKVIELSSLYNPIWITDSGQIASLNFGDVPESSLFVKAYDPNGLTLRYDVMSGYKLPDGLDLNESTGQIYGKCKTKETKVWSFRVSVSNGLHSAERLFKIETNKVASDKYIKWKTPNNLGSFKVGDNVFLNLEAESNYNIKYTLLSNTLPKGLSFNNGLIYGKIKYQDTKTYSIAVEANNGYNTIQDIFIMNVAKGLGQNALKCYFYINHEYDDDYAEMLSYFNKSNAYEPKNPLYKINSTPEIDICECKCFDIQLMKHLLNYNESIDITWGKTIRKDFYNGDDVLYTVFYKDVKENIPTGGYHSWGGDKIYVTESSESSTGYYLEGTKTEVVKQGDLYENSDFIIKGKPYIRYKGFDTFIKILDSNDYYITNTKEIVSDTDPIYTEEYQEYNIYTFKTESFYRKYVLKDGEKCYITKCNEGDLADINNNIYLGINKDEAEIKYTPDIKRKYFLDNKRTNLKIPSTTEIRNSLNTTIQVVKSDNEHIYYDPGSQEIISEEDFENKYILYYNEDKQSYYVKYNGKPVYLDVYSSSVDEGETEIKPAYAEFENSDWIEGIDNKDASQSTFDSTYDNQDAYVTKFKYVIDGNETKYVIKPIKVLVDFLDTEVDYQSYLIFEKGTTNLLEDIVFTLSWYPYTSFIIKDGQWHMIEKISKPWIYEPSLNEEIGFEKRIILPYIHDEDVENLVVRGKTIGKCIKFFDMDNETLPQWKVRNIEFYKVDKYYYPGDIFKVNTADGLTYFKVRATFKSGENYEDYKEDYLITLDDDTITRYLKPYYFPSLDLFYSNPFSVYGENGSVLPKNMENDEDNGKLLTGRKFCFFEVHFSPLYNNNIDNFTIDFYNHNNDRSPEFQLI